MCVCQNGARRRTAGGVYLFLVKADTNITRDQEDVIFYGSAEERKRQQREMKRRRWQHHRDNINATESYPAGDDLRPLPDRRDLFLLESLHSDTAEPSSQLTDVTNTEMCDDDGAGDVDDDVDDVVNIELDLV